METTNADEGLFLENPEIFRDESGENTIEVINDGRIFEAVFEGKKQKIRPFTGHLIDKEKFTEIVLGFITEKNKVSYYGIMDYGKRENHHLYPQILEAMNLLYEIKVLNSCSCEYCYQVVRKCDKFLIDGQFYNSETIKVYRDKKYNEEKLAIKKKVRRRNWILSCAIIIAIIVLKVVVKLNLHF